MLSNLFIILAVGIVACTLVVGLLYVFLRYLDNLVLPDVDFSKGLNSGNMAIALFLAALSAAFVLGLFLYAGQAIGAEYSHYDAYFKRSTKLVWGYEPCHALGRTCDWRVFKAQGITESALESDVCSHVGACGVMQFMPDTAKYMGLTNRFEAKQSIEYGIKYNRRLWKEWHSPRPLGDRLSLTFASYNAGLGHVLSAQKQANGAALFSQIKPYLWREPQEYVERIQRWHKRLSPREIWQLGSN